VTVVRRHLVEAHLAEVRHQPHPRMGFGHGRLHPLHHHDLVDDHARVGLVDGDGRLGIGHGDAGQLGYERGDEVGRRARRDFAPIGHAGRKPSRSSGSVCLTIT
jgi:hypothetical protein